jgi:hypothetical protein
MRYPAPVQGIDIRQSLGSGDLNHCVYTYNLLPFEYGMRVRFGYREWQIGVDDGVNLGIHTLVPFDSAEEDDVGDKLFAVNNEGIWDVTSFDTTPVQDVVFADQSAKAGYGTYAHYVSDAGDDILFYADAKNGLHRYTASTGLWTIPTDITGVDVTKVKFIVAHKQRIWMVEESSTSAWYLGVGSIAGAATQFFFGSKFKHGGTLEGLFSWTVDGGAGVDDMLVAISHAGDVVVYQGSDPSLDDWEVRGGYYVGELPNTPRFASEQGGELYILSAYGLSSMNDLLQGVDSNTLQADLDGTTIAAKIAGLIRDKMKTGINLDGWDVSMIPSQGGMLIQIPTEGSAAALQYYYNFSTQGWGIWRGVPMTCFEEYEDSVFFGTLDGRVCRMDVPLDNIKLDDSNPLDVGDAIEFSILTAFNSMGQDGVFKRVKLIRPDFVAQEEPEHSSVARFDFDVSEAIDFQLYDPVRFPVGNWDVNNWDEAIWGSSTGLTFPTIGGAWGTGRYVAIATKGTTRSVTRLVGWDIIFDAGGVMW